MFICELEGVRGRSIKIYDNKCEISTGVTVGSVITGNATDGRKTIFYIDCVGVQFKESGIAIGCLQFETASGQMNNVSSNFFAENSFTFENNVNGVTNAFMYELYQYVVNRIEGYKYNDKELLEDEWLKTLPSIYKIVMERKKEKEEREKRQRDRLEKEKKEAEQQIEREQYLKNYIKNIDSSVKESELEKVIVFFNNASSCKKMEEVKKILDASGIYSEGLFKDIFDDVNKKVSVERMYGSNPNEVNIFVNSWMKKLEL